MVWAGMRGAVTLAAAQTLPLNAPARASLIMIAVFVAVGSLIIQDLTLKGWVDLVKPRMEGHVDEEEQERLLNVIDAAGRHLTEEHSEISLLRMRAAHADMRLPSEECARLARRYLKIIRAQRSALIDVRRRGLYSTAAITAALEQLDEQEILVVHRMNQC